LRPLVDPAEYQTLIDGLETSEAWSRVPTANREWVTRQFKEASQSTTANFDAQYGPHTLVGFIAAGLRTQIESTSWNKSLDFGSSIAGQAVLWASISKVPVSYELGPARESDGSKVVLPLLIDGREIPITMSSNTASNGNPDLQDVETIAKAVATLPSQNRNLICGIDVSDNPYLWDPLVRVVYPSFQHAGASADGNGMIHIFPHVAWSDVDYSSLAETLLHETGHVWSSRRYGRMDLAQLPTQIVGQGWARWRAAADADGSSWGAYADNAPAEDAAETTVIYQASRGIPAFDLVRSQYPNRFRLLDEVFGGNSTPNPTRAGTLRGTAQEK